MLPGSAVEDATTWIRLWRWPGGPYLHRHDAMVGGASPLELSDDGKVVLIPYETSAVLLSTDADGGVVARAPFEGACMRAGSPRIACSW